MPDKITFGTDGWRAIIAEQFTFANVERVAYAIGSYVRETYHGNGDKLPVLVGYDTRFLADRFALRAAQVLIEMGVPARLSVRDVPTPAMAWSAHLEPTAGAVQLTASHNPPEYCGIKYITHVGGPATNDVTEKIASFLESRPESFTAASHDVPRFDPMPPYLKALESRVDLGLIGASGLKVAYDALYSTSRGYIDAVLRDAGVEHKVLHDWRDPLFGGGMPEPKGEYLQELMRVVREGKFDIGIATDGDADRFAVVDADGNYFRPNRLIVLLARHLVRNRGLTGTIVRTVATSHLLDCLASLHGLDIIETPVGFKYIGDVMCQRDVLIGGEESGGVSVKGHIPEKDGILANLLIIEMLAAERKPLSQIWRDLIAELGRDIAQRRADLSFSKPVQSALMERLNEHPFERIGGQPVVRVGRADGLKLYLDESNWLLVRPSGTEPLIRLYFEGTSEDMVAAMVDDFQRQVDELVGKLGAAASPSDLIGARGPAGERA